MGYTAVMHFKGYFGKIKFIINQQFLYPFNFMTKVKVLNCSSFDFGKKIREICIIMIKFFTQVI